MTFDYEEFLNKFAGVEKYKKGKKVKSCCGGKKVTIAQDGAKTKKKLNAHSSVNDDANDNALLEFLNSETNNNKNNSTLDKPILNTQSLNNNLNLFRKYKKTTTKEKLQKRLK